MFMLYGRLYRYAIHGHYGAMDLGTFEKCFLKNEGTHNIVVFSIFHEGLVLHVRSIKERIK
ncbi:hypothetical protein CEV08_02505 [Bartonella tribocorum]|uniref:Uncharacterized protein n=1 Tax=Bartonella tribocorum TaxID=85701 RepID=A0A2M6UX15_9HYPH|nr:hypothetical protein CEV08_02505 [Bartonella tribocorum]